MYYVIAVQSHQLCFYPNIFLLDIRTEPKFELPNGDVFAGAWCRPQNDGPGLRLVMNMRTPGLVAADVK